MIYCNINILLYLPLYRKVLFQLGTDPLILSPWILNSWNIWDRADGINLSIQPRPPAKTCRSHKFSSKRSHLPDSTRGYDDMCNAGG